MIRKKEALFEKLLLESFPNERSAYFQTEENAAVSKFLQNARRKLKWHIDHSLSPRQKEVMRQYLDGRKEREIAENLGITQQVVNIYKHRAIRQLQRLLAT
jgi:DNA-directed RNA polymerase specialized sigma24 family protein